MYEYNYLKMLPFLQTNVSSLNMLIVIQNVTLTIVYAIISLYQMENYLFIFI